MKLIYNNITTINFVKQIQIRTNKEEITILMDHEPVVGMGNIINIISDQEYDKSLLNKLIFFHFKKNFLHVCSVI